MSGEIPEWSRRLCFVWTTDRPLVGRVRKSQTFEFLNTKCHLKLSCDGNGNYLNLEISPNLTIKSPGVFVTVHLENEKGEVIPLCSTHRLVTYTCCIWHYYESFLVQSIPDYYEGALITFVITVDDDDQLKNTLTLKARDLNLNRDIEDCDQEMMSRAVRVFPQCFVWTTEKPHANRSRISRKFHFKDAECHLELRYIPDQYVLTLCHFKKEWQGCTVTVHFENRVHEALPLSSRITLSPQTLDIWRCTKTDIEKAIPYFYTDGLMIFVLIFDENASSRSDTEGKVGEIKGPEIESNIGNKVENYLQLSFDSDANACLNTLSADLSDQLDHGSNYDLELKCGGHTFKAHRFLLSTRSQVFKVMLQSDVTEARTGVIEIKDMDYEILEHFIRYLYTGKLPVLTTVIATRLYEAGDCYGVKALAKRCSGFLAQRLMPENACQMLALADVHSDQPFRDYVQSYILRRKIFQRDDQWLPFCDSHPMLALEVLNKTRNATN